MSGNGNGRAVTHFGRQMRKERLARNWSLREMSARTGVDHATLSRIESGARPPTERVAKACDRVFPERAGWFLEYYEDSKSWVPAGFRSWAEYEDRAAVIRSWTPSFADGSLQTADYARAQLETAAGATPEMIAARLANRMARQQRVLFRDSPPEAWFVVDELALYRQVGTIEVMAAQLHHMAEVARLPNVFVQVLPAVAHPAGASSFMLADNAAYAEHVAGGYVFTGDQRFTDMSRLMATILSESMKASESLQTLESLEAAWTGGSPLTATRTAGSA